MAKRGITRTICSEYGETEWLNILCTFSYERKKYFIAIDDDGACVCREIKWNLSKGVFQNTDYVDDKVADIANMLLRKAERKPEFYVFKAEHYKVRENRNKLSVTKHRRLTLLSPCMKNIPFVSRLIVAILCALLYGFICVNTFGITVAANVFNGLSRNNLVSLVYVIQVVGAVALFLIRRFERDIADLSCNAVIPYNVIALIGACKISRPVSITVISIAVISFLILILPKIIQAIKARKKSFKIKCLKTAFRRCYAPFVICLFVAFVAIQFFGVSGDTDLGANSNDYEFFDAETYFEVRYDLESSKWNTFSNQEKLDVLQTICNYECIYKLGCNPPKVVAGDLERDTICGKYNRSSDTITISSEHLAEKPVEDVLGTLLHETRHAYQYAVVNMYNNVEENLDSDDLTLTYFEDARSYRENFDDYKSAEDDYYEYYYQVVEVDSRTWADLKIDYVYYFYMYPES